MLQQTSLLAWERVKKSLTNREEQVLAALEELGVANAYQVQEKMGYHNINMVAPRLTGLLQKGLIEIDHTGLNEFGNSAHFYKVKE